MNGFVSKRQEDSRLRASFKLLDLLGDELRRQSWVTEGERQSVLGDVAAIFEKLCQLESVEERRLVEGAVYPKLELRGRGDV